MNPKEINFTVQGEPYPKSEPNVTIVGSYRKREYNPKYLEFEERILHEVRRVRAEMNIHGRPPAGMVNIAIDFYLKRPADHYINDWQGLKPWADDIGVNKWPSITMLSRGVIDVLAGNLFETVNSVESISCKKQWSSSDPFTSVSLTPVVRSSGAQPELNLEG